MRPVHKLRDRPVDPNYTAAAIGVHHKVEDLASPARFAPVAPVSVRLRASSADFWGESSSDPRSGRSPPTSDGAPLKAPTQADPQHLSHGRGPGTILAALGL